MSHDDHERSQALADLESRLEVPMLVLSFAWLALVLVELTWGSSGTLEALGTVIWLVFIIEFGIRLTLAPSKPIFLKRNLISLFALLAPAVRLLRVVRLFGLLRVTRGLRLVKIVGTANRSMNALKASFGRRGLGYLLAATVLVTLLGAAGMLAFEPASEIDGGFTGYWDALWWTSMLITTIGSQYWPQTAEGRILCFLLSLYGLAVFGYITASLASFFVERDTHGPQRDRGAEELARLRLEIEGLRGELRSASAEAARMREPSAHDPGD